MQPLLIRAVFNPVVQQHMTMILTSLWDQLSTCAIMFSALLVVNASTVAIVSTLAVTKA